MCGSMADIQSSTAEIRRGKKEIKKKKPQDKNIMACPIPQGDHNNVCCGLRKMIKPVTCCYNNNNNNNNNNNTAFI